MIANTAVIQVTRWLLLEALYQVKQAAEQTDKYLFEELD